MEKKSHEENMLCVESLISQRDQKPYIQIQFKEQSIQLPVQDAREHALYILEACEAAELDAILLSYLQKSVGFPLTQAVEVVRNFRSYRTGSGEQK
jgi:hypothetical protein